MARKRFGTEVVEQSEPLPGRIDDPQRLEERGEALLESVDGEAGLRILRSMADR